mgnify:CR=1 FL=1
MLTSVESKMPHESAILAAESENSLTLFGTFSLINENPFTYTHPPSNPTTKHKHNKPQSSHHNKYALRRKKSRKTH